MKNKALVVSKLTSAVNTLTKLLDENSVEVGRVVSDSQSARELANDTIYDIVVINSPIDDGDGVELAVEISEKTVCGVVLIVPAEKASYFGSRVSDYGIVIVSKPINRSLFTQLLGVVRAAQKRYAGLTKENERLRSSIEESKIINRAKFLLMQHLSLSEERAHKYIERQAMDMRISRLEVAKQVLKTYSARKR
ncbi:MAG: ANTAR domain-containing protein [Clostridia bacterium]|nr:ANTAR domain-containing protein [Clostridia bacterium]